MSSMTQTPWWRQTLALTLLVAATGCGALDVSDPNTLGDKELANASGAELMRRGALSGFYSALSANAPNSGMLADEFFANPRQSEIHLGDVGAPYYLDLRQSLSAEQTDRNVYARLHEARVRTSRALELVRAHAPEAVRGPYAAEMLAVRGFFELILAEDYCPGVPLNDLVDERIVFGEPTTTAQLLEHAIAGFDSALALAADSVRIADLARVGKARALLNLGQFDSAGTTAASVLAGFVWEAEFGPGGPQNRGLVFTRGSQISVADHEGGNGLGFVSAADPRVTTKSIAIAEDGVTRIYAIGKYPNRNAPIVVASKVEARLIEAEAALRRGDANWLTILNDLRATAISPGLAPLADPGSADARIDLLFLERAFWLFATDHRLGDLRRLVRVYGRDPSQVFPTGSYWLGGGYGAATALPFPASQERGVSCTSR
jgi:hypothetical protein